MKKIYIIITINNNMFFSNLHKYLLRYQIAEGIFFPNYYVDIIKSNPVRNNLRIYQIEGCTFWSKKKLIGSIDLVLEPEIKTVNIPCWFCNDKNTIDKLFGGKYYEILDDVTANNTKKILFDYAEYFAKNNNCNILQRDVHHSLREFNDDLKNFGFELNGKKADDHNAWLQSFKKL